MKRFVIALVLLGIALSAGICAQTVFFKKTQELIDVTDSLLTAVDSGDSQRMEESLGLVVQSWENTKTALHMIMIHSALDEIEININSLGEFFRAGDTQAMRESCLKALRQLESLQDSSRLTVENIF